MMYRGTPLETRYAKPGPQATTAAELMTSVLSTTLFALAGVAILAGYYVVASF